MRFVILVKIDAVKKCSIINGNQKSFDRLDAFYRSNILKKTFKKNRNITSSKKEKGQLLLRRSWGIKTLTANRRYDHFYKFES